MGSFGLLPLKQVWAMLKRCAPGHTIETREHNHCIRYNGRTFPNLPLGPHGARTNSETQVGHVKHMVRQLELEIDCVNRELPQLRLKSHPQ